MNTKKRFIFYSPRNFEQWDWRNLETGIGGSETCHIEMSWRLAQRGHEVISYTNIPGDCPREWKNTKWFHLDECDFQDEGIWILFRCPDIVDKFAHLDNKELWLMMQDEDYPGSWNDERIAKLTRIMPLCKEHARNVLRNNPSIPKEKIWITTNGVRVDLIREIEKGSIPERNPKRLIYASSPDRGLKALLKIFKRAREFVNDLELHIYYGFNNIDKLVILYPHLSHFKDTKTEILKAAEQDGVYFHGRVSQRELYQAHLQSGLWVYPSLFTETSCVTCMESQALGPIPITNPLWALGENVHHGVFIQGDCYNDFLTQARYVGAIVRLANDVNLQENIRKEMMADSRFRFNWERIVDDWEASIWGYGNQVHVAQYNFQIKHAEGTILNVGSDVDLPNLQQFQNAINVDIRQTSNVDIVCDARQLSEMFNGQKFDTIILGDIVEHLTDDDILKVLTEAKMVSKGKIIITCPEDNRTKKAQQDMGLGYRADEYPESVYNYHYKPITKELLFDLVQQAGLSITHYEPIDYTFAGGHGVLCC